MKDRLIKDIEIALSYKGFGKDDIEKALQCVIGCLDEYDVSERVTDLVVRHDDINEKILKRYVACMRLDGKSEGTIRMYTYTLKRLSESSQRAFNEMSANDIRFFLSSLKEGRKNSYIKSQRANIASFFRWMQAEDITQKNVCEKVNDIKCEEEVRLPFTPVEIDKLRRVCRGCNQTRNRAIIEVLLSSGVRCAELCSIETKDLSLTERKINIRNGKGGKGRIVFVSDLAVEYIRKYLGERKTSYLFESTHKGKLTTDGVRRMLVKHAEVCGVTNVHPHRFRRTFATTMYKRGMQLEEIRRLMGHSEVQTTLRYIYTDDTQLLAAYNKYVA